MVEPHKKNALIEAMQCPKAKEVAETASKGSYSYMLDRLKSKYAMPRILFPLHWKALTIRSTINWRKEDIDSLANDLDYHVRGLQEIAAATFEHIVAHLVIQSFSKECREQWDRFEGVSSNPPVLSQVVDFIQQASLRLSGREEIEESPSTFSSSSSKPTAGSKRVKAFQTRSRESKAKSQENKSTCSICKGDGHKAFQCQTLKDKTPNQRCQVVRNLHLCFNCLSSGHSAIQSQSR